MLGDACVTQCMQHGCLLHLNIGASILVPSGIYFLSFPNTVTPHVRTWAAHVPCSHVLWLFLECLRYPAPTFYVSCEL